MISKVLGDFKNPKYFYKLFFIINIMKNVFHFVLNYAQTLFPNVSAPKLRTCEWVAGKNKTKPTFAYYNELTETINIGMYMWRTYPTQQLDTICEEIAHHIQSKLWEKRHGSPIVTTNHDTEFIFIKQRLLGAIQYDLITSYEMPAEDVLIL